MKFLNLLRARRARQKVMISLETMIIYTNYTHPPSPATPLFFIIQGTMVTLRVEVVVAVEPFSCATLYIPIQGKRNEL